MEQIGIYTVPFVIAAVVSIGAIKRVDILQMQALLGLKVILNLHIELDKLI